VTEDFAPELAARMDRISGSLPRPCTSGLPAFGQNRAHPTIPSPVVGSAPALQVSADQVLNRENKRPDIEAFDLQ